MGRRNKKRGNIAPFIKLDMWVQNTLAWRDLGPVARALYIELRARYNGTNNGFIGLGAREFKEWRPGGKTNRSPRNETLSPRNETQAPPETRCVSGQGRNAPLTDELAYQDGDTYRSTTGWRAANG